MRLIFAVCLQHRRKWSDQRDKKKKTNKQKIYILRIKKKTNKQDDEEKKDKMHFKKVRILRVEKELSPSSLWKIKKSG